MQRHTECHAVRASRHEDGTDKPLREVEERYGIEFRSRDSGADATECGWWRGVIILVAVVDAIRCPLRWC